MKKRTGIVIWLILSQLIALASLLLWLAVVGLSIMAFDSGDNASARLLVYLIWAYPLIPIVCTILAWVFFRARRDRWALLVTSLPLLLLLLPAAFFLISL